MASILDLLRPTAMEIVALAKREGDVQCAKSFAPICFGPVAAIAGLIAIGIVAAVTAPVRLALRLARRGH